MHAGKHNTAEAGAWAGVVVETYANGRQESWVPSDGVEAGKSVESEIQAVIGGLRAVATREVYRPGSGELPPITLHTDSQLLIAKILKNPGRHPQGQELCDLVEDLNAKVIYGSHDKAGKGRKRESHPEIGQAHEEGHRRAWSLRAKKQGDKIHSHSTGWIDVAPEDDGPKR